MTNYTPPQSGFSIIQLRRASAEFWTAQNPILRKGEAGYETTSSSVTTGNLKIGDGLTPWNDLPYYSVPNVNLTAPFVDGQGIIYDSATDKWKNETVVAAASVAKIKPSPATDGALWFDPEDARLYRYYDDGAGTPQWVEINQTIAQQSNTFTSGVTIGGTLGVTGATTLSSATLSTPLAITSGGTGATTASTARTNLGVAALGDAGVPFRVAAGSVSGPSNNSASVTFPAGRFSVTPILTAVVASNPNNNVAVVYFGAITSTGFSVSAYTIGGAQIAATFHWQAIQMTSGAAAG
jgi:hypothetical protein